jgi:hypothetical protein
MVLLVIEQEAFDRQTTAKAGQAAVGTDHTMTRHHDR